MAKLGLVNTTNTDVEISGDPGVLAALGLTASTLPAGNVHTINYSSGLPSKKNTILKSTVSFPLSKEGEVINGEFHITINDINIQMKNPRFGEVARKIQDTIRKFDNNSGLWVSWETEQSKMRFVIVSSTGSEIVATDLGTDNLLEAIGFNYNHPNTANTRTVWKSPTPETNDTVYVLTDKGGLVKEDVLDGDIEIKVSNPLTLTRPDPSIMEFADLKKFTFKEFSLEITLNLNTAEEYTEIVSFDSPTSIEEVANLIGDTRLAQNGLSSSISGSVLTLRNHSGGLFRISDAPYNGNDNPTLQYLVPGSKKSKLEANKWYKFSRKPAQAEPGIMYAMSDSSPVMVRYWYLNYKSTATSMGGDTPLLDIDSDSNAYGVIRSFNVGYNGTTSAGKYSFSSKKFDNVTGQTFALDTPVTDNDTVEITLTSNSSTFPCSVNVQEGDFVFLSGIADKENKSNPTVTDHSIAKPYIDYITPRLTDPSCNINTSNTVRTTIPETEYSVFTGEAIVTGTYSEINSTVFLNRRHFDISFDGLSITIYSAIVDGSNVNIAYNKKLETTEPVISANSRFVPITDAQTMSDIVSTLSGSSQGNYTRLLDSGNTLSAMMASNTFEYFDK